MTCSSSRSTFITTTPTQFITAMWKALTELPSPLVSPLPFPSSRVSSISWNATIVSPAAPRHMWSAVNAVRTGFTIFLYDAGRCCSTQAYDCTYARVWEAVFDLHRCNSPKMPHTVPRVRTRLGAPQEKATEGFCTRMVALCTRLQQLVSSLPRHAASWKRHQGLDFSLLMVLQIWCLERRRITFCRRNRCAIGARRHIVCKSR